MSHPGPLGGDDRPLADPPVVGQVPPPAVPAVPAYEPSELLEPTPAYDTLAQESGLGSPVQDAPAQEPVLSGAFEPVPAGQASGPMATLQAFAGKSPAAFLGVALAAGWLVGKLFFSSSSDDDES